MSIKHKSPVKKASAGQDKQPWVYGPDISAETFTDLWNESATLKALAEMLNVSASTCATHAARLRKEGYALKWFRKGRPRLLKL